MWAEAEVPLVLVSNSNSEPNQVSKEEEKLDVHMLFTWIALSPSNYF